MGDVFYRGVRFKHEHNNSDEVCVACMAADANEVVAERDRLTKFRDSARVELESERTLRIIAERELDLERTEKRILVSGYRSALGDQRAQYIVVAAKLADREIELNRLADDAIEETMNLANERDATRAELEKMREIVTK